MQGGLSRGKLEVAAAQLGGGEAGHDLRGLHSMEVSIKFIRAPATDHANAISTDAGAQKGHGAAGASGPGGNFGRVEGRVGKDREGIPKTTSDIACANIPCRSARGVAEGVDRGRRSYVKCAKGDNAGDERKHGTDMRMAQTAVANGLVAYGPRFSVV